MVDYLKVIFKIQWMSPKILVLNNGSAYCSNLIQYLMKRDCEVFMENPYGSLSQITKGYDGVIISGGIIPEGAIDEKKRGRSIAWYKGFLEQSIVPVLGICFGHLMIGMIYGGRRGKMIESGERLVKLNFPLLKGETTVYQDHKKGILRVSRRSPLIAYRDENSGLIQALSHNKRPIYSVQFHPEVRGAEVLDNFLELVS